MKTVKDVFCNALLILMTVAASGFAESDAVRYVTEEVSNLHLSSSTDSGKVVYAYPGEQIEGYADLKSYRERVNAVITQVIVGLAGIGAQDGLGYGDFNLIAPEKPGIYEVRFRYAQAYTLSDAIRYWWNMDQAPPWQTTIGLVIVSENPEKDARKINDSNWKNWLIERHANNDHVGDGIEIAPILTSDMISPDFWDTSASTGEWMIDDGVVSNKGNPQINEYYTLISKQAFEQFQLNVTAEYQYLPNQKSAPRGGFSVLYYVNDLMNIEFRYYPDGHQIYMYVRDSDKESAVTKLVYFPPGTPIVQDISVVDGLITWKLNDKVVLEEKTSLKHGRLSLTNYNNEVTFQF